MKLGASITKTHFAGAKGTEIFSSPWDDVFVEFEVDAAGLLWKEAMSDKDGTKEGCLDAEGGGMERRRLDLPLASPALMLPKASISI